MTEAQKRMTKGERDDLIRLIKQREKVAKSAATQRAAAMLAEFERRIVELHDFDTDEVWSAATACVSAATKKANQEINERSAELGIPAEFRPAITFNWNCRGQAEYEMRRAELRRVAKAEIEVVEKTLRVHIESESVKAQTEVVTHGMESAAALSFLESLPPIEAMMPELSIDDIQRKLADNARRKVRHPYLVE